MNFLSVEFVRILRKDWVILHLKNLVQHLVCLFATSLSLASNQMATETDISEKFDEPMKVNTRPDISLQISIMTKMLLYQIPETVCVVLRNFVEAAMCRVCPQTGVFANQGMACLKLVRCVFGKLPSVASDIRSETISKKRGVSLLLYYPSNMLQSPHMRAGFHLTGGNLARFREIFTLERSEIWRRF